MAADAPQATSTRRLDELDRRIIDVLRRDGRRSVTSVAQDVGVTKQTVAKRLDRLLESETIRITALVDPVALGFPLFWSIGVRVRPDARDRVAERLAAMDQIAWVAWCTGGFDIMLEAFLADTVDVFEFLNERLGGMPDIIATRESLVLRSAKYDYLWDEGGAGEPLSDGDGRGPARGWSTGPAAARGLVRVDDLDRTVIGLLRQDGRRPFADMARRAGVAEGTVASRVDRLVRSGALLVVAQVDWPAAGHPVHVNMGVKVARGQAVRVGERVAAHPKVSYVGYTTGEFDLLVEAFLPDNAGLLEFIDAHVGAIPEVESIETWHVLRVTKSNAEWEGERLGREVPR